MRQLPFTSYLRRLGRRLRVSRRHHALSGLLQGRGLLVGEPDNRNYEVDWGEKWQGSLVENPDGTTNYNNRGNQLPAEDLKGKLLLAHGTMDDNVPLYNTLLVVNAIIAANKNFDFILFTNRRHSLREATMTRRHRDYFVRHFMGAEPPLDYEIKPAAPSTP